MINLNYNNKSIAGNVGLGQAIGWYSSQGHSVSIPLTDTQEYDLVIDKGEKLEKIQVKTTRHKREGSNNYTVHLKTCGGNQSWDKSIKRLDLSKIDELFVLVETGEMYAIPSKNVGGTCGITLGEKYKDFKVN